MDGEAFVIFTTVLTSHALVFGVFYYFFRNRHRERMSMIEKGVDPSIFIKKPSGSVSIALKYGLFLAGLAIGLFAASLLDHFTQLEEAPVYFSMIFLFGGIGLLAYYIIERKNAKSGGA
jgi:hypothetical protein